MSTDPREQDGTNKDDPAFQEDPYIEPGTPGAPEPDDTPAMDDEDDVETGEEDQRPPQDPGRE